MILIEVLLPLYDNQGQPIDRSVFEQVGAELTQRFGGLTAHTRAPATGLWKPGAREHTTRDEIVIYEVMANALDREWWAAYRERLEARFRQEQIVIRAVDVQLL